MTHVSATQLLFAHRGLWQLECRSEISDLKGENPAESLEEDGGDGGDRTDEICPAVFSGAFPIWKFSPSRFKHVHELIGK